MTDADPSFETQSLVAIGLIVAIGFVHIASIPIIRSLPKFAYRLADFTAGIGLGYVFLYLLPKIGDATTKLQSAGAPGTNEFLTYRYYLYLLLGFLIYYLTFAEPGKDRNRSSPRLYFDISIFCIYNILVAITALHLDRAHYFAHLIVAAVFMLHLFGINFSLIKWHGHAIERWIRWAFTGSLAFGIVLGVTIEPGDHFVMIATSLVGGIIIILSTRLKLPTKDALDRVPFLIGITLAIALAYAGRSIDKL
ncbi:hypothetical protein LP7551_01722 [Roseibium album]|nr:hypothetical protein LP7551_01722 [Roseibium album]